MDAKVLSFSTHPSPELSRWLKDGEWPRIGKALEDGVNLHLSWKEGGSLWQRIMLCSGRSSAKPSSVQALNQRNLLRQCMHHPSFTQEDLVTGITQSVWWARPDFFQLFLEDYPTQTHGLAHGVFEMVVRRKVITHAPAHLPKWDLTGASQCFQLLKKQGVSLQGDMFEAWTPLQMAFNLQDEDLFRALLIAQANPLIKNKQGVSTWDLVWSHRDILKMQWVINTSFQQVVMEEEKPLVCSAQQGDALLFRLLFAAAPFAQQREAWFKAAETNHVAILSACMDLAPHLNWLLLKDPDGNSALHFASHGHAPTAQTWLLEKGAEGSLNNQGLSPQDIWFLSPLLLAQAPSSNVIDFAKKKER